MSFEPLEAAYSKLRAHASPDASWECVRTALGASVGEAVLHVAGNSVSSSLLPMAHLHQDMFPESAYVGDERVPVDRLDAVAACFLAPNEPVLLKLDVQGYELAALAGAEELLRVTSVVEVEMSTRELYQDQPLWHEVVQFLIDRDFELSIAHELIVDARTGCLLQMDGVFTKRAHIRGS